MVGGGDTVQGPEGADGGLSGSSDTKIWREAGANSVLVTQSQVMGLSGRHVDRGVDKIHEWKVK